MAAALAKSALLSLNFKTLAVLRAYRRRREDLADGEVADFEGVLAAEIAQQTGLSAERVAAIVHDWMTQRPLPKLRPHRYPGVAELFDDLRRSGRQIGVLSDYPAREKLAALGLDADIVVCAADEEVGYMKPNPRGLNFVMAKAGVTPGATILIGDRADRDGEAGRRAGVRTYLRTSKPIAGEACFASFQSLRVALAG